MAFERSNTEGTTEQSAEKPGAYMNFFNKTKSGKEVQWAYIGLKESNPAQKAMMVKLNVAKTIEERAKILAEIMSGCRITYVIPGEKSADPVEF